MPKEKLKTKEELIKDNVNLQLGIDGLHRRDGDRRKEFAKVLNFYDSGYYGSDRNPRDLSWEQIFAELGRLLTLDELRKVRATADEMAQINMRISEELRQLKNK